MVNDRQRMHDLEARGKDLLHANKATPIKELAGQLAKAACGVAPAPPPPGAEKLSAAGVYDRGAPGVLVIGTMYKCDRCPNVHCSPASGFLISESGVAVTNYHVVNQPDKMALVAMTLDGAVYAVKEVLAASEADDLAVLQLALPEDSENGAADGEPRLRPLPLGESAAAVGSDVFVISHPDHRLYTLSRGMVSRYSVMRRNNKDTVSMQVTADYARGSSGAPVLDERGAVVGIVSSTASVYYNVEPGKPHDNLQMVFKDCVPVEKLRKLLRARLKEEAAPAAGPLDVKD